MTVFEVFSIIGLIIAVVSFIVAARSAVDQTRTRAADFSFRVWERFRADDVQKAFLLIEWGEFHYPYATKTGFKTDEQERQIDRLLSLLDDVVGLAAQRILSKSDVERWRYIGVRVFQDEGIQRYMVFLKSFYQLNGVSSGPHVNSETFFRRSDGGAWSPFRRGHGDEE